MDGLKLFGAAIAGYALATLSAVLLQRRGRRVYVTVTTCGTPRGKAEAFDWRKPGNAPESVTDADSGSGDAAKS